MDNDKTPTAEVRWQLDDAQAKLRSILERGAKGEIVSAEDFRSAIALVDSLGTRHAFAVAADEINPPKESGGGGHSRPPVGRREVTPLPKPGKR